MVLDVIGPTDPPQTIAHSRSIPMIHGAMGIFAPIGTNKLLISLANGLENVSYSEVHPFVFQQYSGFRKQKIYLPPPYISLAILSIWMSFMHFEPIFKTYQTEKLLKKITDNNRL